MTSDLSISAPLVDTPAVPVAPLEQSDRDAALLTIWQGSRHLPLEQREALLERYASSSVLSGPNGDASEPGEPRHLRQVVGRRGYPRVSSQQTAAEAGPASPASAVLFHPFKAG